MEKLEYNFKYIQKLGKGKYGIIYKSLYNNKIVVIKEINKNNYKNSTLKFLKGEIEVMKVLTKNCPDYCINYIEDLEDDLYYYIITEYINGYITLYEYIKNYKYNYIEIGYIYNNLVKGLIYIHSNKIAHRDIKPENIMINPITYKIKYIDFGFSCIGSKCTIIEKLGSKLYLPPEINLCNYIDVIVYEKWITADIWALGHIILELILHENYYIKQYNKTSINKLSLEEYFWKIIRNKIPINLKIIPKQFIENYPNIYNSLEKMLNLDNLKRNLPNLEDLI